MPGPRPFPVSSLDRLLAVPEPHNDAPDQSTTAVELPSFDATVTMTGGLAGSIVATASVVGA